MDRSDLVRALERFATSEDVAKLTGYPLHYISIYWKRGKLPKPIGKLGRSYVWDKEELLEWVTQKESSENAG